jgi:hypothetical protein
MREMCQRERGREVVHREEERRALLGTPSTLVSNSPLGVPLYRWRDETHLIQ